MNLCGCFVNSLQAIVVINKDGPRHSEWAGR